MSASYTTDLLRLESSQGRAMKGLLFRPEAVARPSVGFVYLPGIVLGATAMHRLGFDVAAHLAQAGYPACLVDQTGIGESEGDYPEGTHKALTAWVEAGNLVDDTIAAIDEFRRVSQVETVALIGHCGGALTAIYALAQAPASAALVMSVPVVSVGARDDLAHTIAVDQYVTLYASKLTNVDAWKRILTGQSDYRTLAKLVRRKVGQKARALIAGRPGKAGLRTASSEFASEPASSAPRFNNRLKEAWTAASSHGKRIRVVFGDHDPDVEDFRAFLQEVSGISHVILPETSHGFVTEASLALLWQEIDAFAASEASGHAWRGVS